MIAPAPPPEHDVFISYSSVDNELAQRLAEHLEDIDGIRPFVDRWHLVPGETAQERLEEVLASVPAVAVLVGDEGLGPWQDEEVRAAIKRRAEKRDVRVIPVLLPGVSNKSVELPAFLDRYLHVDFADSIEERGCSQRLVVGIRGRPPGRRSRRRSPVSHYLRPPSTNELVDNQQGSAERAS
ncbi:MAG: toll/interleukin-1 receptor domain-containing protein [Actinobacteria bacterium]|nr:toll/interleukin-1 receptor domain-containing protein [Actinomycetota bacterium]